MSSRSPRTIAVSSSRLQSWRGRKSPAGSVVKAVELFSVAFSLQHCTFQLADELGPASFLREDRSRDLKRSVVGGFQFRLFSSEHGRQNQPIYNVSKEPNRDANVQNRSCSNALWGLTPRNYQTKTVGSPSSA